ncbi:MAG: DUF1800 domain-containing protein [Fluviicola sp. XM-24bin1]|nr:MAG: DUF1800 domain-containing protein [Fluviicola sp. XM-24bin1]
MALSDLHIQHLYWRAGFGITRNDLQSIRKKSVDKHVDHLFNQSEYKPLKYNLSQFEVDRKELSKEERKALRKEANQTMIKLNLHWMEHMVATEGVLREKMALFFHDHFAVRLKNPVVCLELLNIIRKHSIGNFGDMLLEISQSPAMIIFLNNQQNKKSHPNENFAREVMELFTLGRDNGYTENDIKEAARAFTGWTIDKQFKFRFNPRVHDTGGKTILGRSGNFKGEDVIQILLEQKQTARYLCEKLLEFLLGVPAEKEDIERCADLLFQNNYDLSVLLRSIFTSDTFYDERYVGAKIKSPTDLLVGLNRQVPIDYKDPKVILQIQRRLNQVLFFPPNVAGWNRGQGWIDSSTLLFRMKLPSLVLNFGVIEWQPDETLSEEMIARLNNQQERLQKRTEKKIQAYPNWERCEKNFAGSSENLDTFLLQTNPVAIDIQSDDDLKTRIIKIMSTPEYQLC